MSPQSKEASNFDLSRVFTCVTADKLKKGDKVFVADDLYSLRIKVEEGKDTREIVKIMSEFYDARFQVLSNSENSYKIEYALAYLKD